MARDPIFDEAHSAVAIGIAEKFLTQPRDMTWEDRTDELATAAIEAMQVFIQLRRWHRSAIAPSETPNLSPQGHSHE
jgi:hypothetical protein